MKVSSIDVSDNVSLNTEKSILARLYEGNDTYVSVKAYGTQPVGSKMFAIEHKFYGLVNNSINFYRGGAQTGGSVGIAVNNGTEVARFKSTGLDVNGVIRTKEVKIEVANWPDFVFDPAYKLHGLTEVKKYIEEKKHLPGVPSEAEATQSGVELAKMQAILLQKIEELTLYTIQQDEENQTQKELIKELQTRLSVLETNK